MRTGTFPRAFTLTLVVAAVLLPAPIVRAALAPERQCHKDRYEAASKYAACQHKTVATFFAKVDTEKLQEALSKCRTKYTSTWTKIRKKALGTGSTCDTNRFVNNGGSVTDNLTGLEWEKKTDDGFTHDKDDSYLWSAASFIFLAGGSGLNGALLCMSVVPFKCDWRLPTHAELQTLLSEPYPCSTAPCIDPIFGPTIPSNTWTATQLADNLAYAWIVDFGTGEVFYHPKSVAWFVRGVRGGL